MDFTTNPGSGTANYRVPDPDSVAAFIPSSDQCIPAPTPDSCAGNPATLRESAPDWLASEAILKDLSDAMNKLYFELSCAQSEGGITVINSQCSPWQKERKIFLGHRSWCALYKRLADWPHTIAWHMSHSEEEQKLPPNKRSYKLTFPYNEVEFFCLMNGKEVLENGFQLPV